MADSDPPLIRALRDPACYPHPVDRVELVETHISWILLAGEFAYKVKKPVTLPFLDYGTIDQRRACCEAELRLNRRFAPQLYVGVVDFDGEPAVKMRRFDEAMRLDHVCKRGALTPAHLTGLAATLARFQAGAAIAPADSRFGSPSAVLAPALENFAELRTLTGDLFAAPLDALERWTRAEFARVEAAITARKVGGFVREGHGDLHLGNMVLLDEAPPPDRSKAARHAGGAGYCWDESTEPPVTAEPSEQEGSPSGKRGPGGVGQKVVPFDGIEFNEDFRWIDVASEIAFTLVDLRDHGQPGLACWLLNEWLAETGDIKALDVLRFYMVYRALVRAKVAAIRACQQGAPVAAGDCPEVRDYLALAHAIAVSPKETSSGASPAPFPGIPLRITLMITCGVSGSGKTTATTQRLLADPQASTIRLRSDVERKRLFGLGRHDASGSALDAGIYTPEATQRTYARLAELTESLLDAGWPVIVDAAFLKRDERAAFRAIAQRRSLAFTILACAAASDELHRRVATRSGDASEATVHILEKQLRWIEPLDAVERALSVSA